jgi:hypothetical protein
MLKILCHTKSLTIKFLSIKKGNRSGFLFVQFKKLIILQQRQKRQQQLQQQKRQHQQLC